MQPVFLVGPTAVGKTAVALEVAEAIGGEIVSADSMQVYRGMDIGTGKATAEEQRRVRHHLMDVCDVGDVFDVKQYVEQASKTIDSLIAKGTVPLVVGGTGLYVRALRQGLFEGPGRDAKLRERLETMTLEALFEELQRLDPVTAKGIDRHNPRRLVRALEYFHLTGESISAKQVDWKQNAEEGGPMFGLERERAELVRRIEGRIDQQMAAGWLEEVRQLMAQGLERNPNALQAAGYRELAAVIRGELELTTAMEQIKARTRQLAKRQMTWFRREAGLRWIRVNEEEFSAETARRIIQYWKESEAER